MLIYQWSPEIGEVKWLCQNKCVFKWKCKFWLNCCEEVNGCRCSLLWHLNFKLHGLFFTEYVWRCSFFFSKGDDLHALVRILRACSKKISSWGHCGFGTTYETRYAKEMQGVPVRLMVEVTDASRAFVWKWFCYLQDEPMAMVCVLQNWGFDLSLSSFT